MKKLSRSAIAVMKKREAETWVYSYADLITNLMALFVMMLVFAGSSQKTKEQFKRGLETYTQAAQAAVGHAGAGVGALDDLRQMISDYLNRVGLAGRISLERTRTGIELTFESALLFESGTADLSPEAEALLRDVAGLLTTLPPRFVLDVEGHADNRPVTSGRYPSNWELSSARAGSVVRALEAAGIASRRMRAIGFAATRPLDGSGEGDVNRRVVIRVNAEDGGS